MENFQKCEIVILPTKQSSRIIRHPDYHDKIMYCVNGNGAEQATNVDRFYIYLIYKNQLIASNDPRCDAARVPDDLVKFFCRLNGIDSIDVAFKNPKFVFHNYEGIKWTRLIYQPLLEGNVIIIRPHRSFKTNTFSKEEL